MHPIWAEILGCFRVEEAGSECEEPRPAGDSSSRLATTSRLPRFYLFPGTPPTPTPKGRSHWDLETSPELGPRQSAQIKNFGPRPPPAAESCRWRDLAPVPGAVRRQVKRASGGIWAKDQPLGTESRIAWAGGPPILVLVYKERLSQCHAFLTRNYFQESELRDVVGSFSERAFYSSQSAACKNMSFSAIGQ